MRRLVTLLSLLAALAAAGRAAEAKVRVVTTIQTFRSLVEEIGGDKVEVTSLVGDSVDPHFVDPRPKYALVLNKADLLVHVGLELERGWLPPLVEQARNRRIQVGGPGNLDASTVGIPVLERGAFQSRSQGDIHPLGNPHYWLPPDNALRVARAIADRLSALDAANAAHYEARYTTFATVLEAKRRDWARRAKPLAGVKVVTYHKSWSYLTSWLGLEEVGYVEPKPGIPPAPSHLAALVKQARAQGARIVIVEAFYPRNTAGRVAELAGMKLAVLSSDVGGDARTYVALLDGLIAQLLAAAQ